MIDYKVLKKFQIHRNKQISSMKILEKLVNDF